MRPIDYGLGFILTQYCMAVIALVFVHGGECIYLLMSEEGRRESESETIFCLFCRTVLVRAALREGSQNLRINFARPSLVREAEY